MTQPDQNPDHDDATPDPANGTSGPGDPGYDGQAQVGVVGGEAEIDLEERRRAMEADPAADPGAAADR